jgi:hypothetical protein
MPIVENDLHKVFQSAYKAFHSMEKTLLREQNDILDKKESVIFVLFDLSAAFDPLAMVLYRTVPPIPKRFAISSRSQFENINGPSSSILDLSIVLPQGPVLGPVFSLFIVYTLMDTLQ